MLQHEHTTYRQKVGFSLSCCPQTATEWKSYFLSVHGVFRHKNICRIHTTDNLGWAWMSLTLVWLHCTCMCVCWLFCLDWPLSVNFKWAHSNILHGNDWRSTPMRVEELLSLLPDCSISVKETRAETIQVECVGRTHGNLLSEKSMLWVWQLHRWQSVWLNR